MNVGSDRETVTKIAIIRGVDGRLAELREALIELEVKTQSEVGCKRFAFFQSITDSNVFILLEEFVNNESFETHLELPHTRKFFNMKLVKSIEAKDIEIDLSSFI